jgi:hypothetical protein
MGKKPTDQHIPEPVAEEEPNPKVKLVYIGPCTTSDKKLGGMFLPITDEQLREKRLPDTLPQERIYGGKVPKLVGRPGTIHEFQCKPENDSSIFGDTRRYVGFLENDPRVVEWQANHDAFFAAEKLKRQEKKGKNRNLIHRHLAPLKVAYNKMVGHQRAAFLAQIAKTPQWTEEKVIAEMRAMLVEGGFLKGRKAG